MPSLRYLATKILFKGYNISYFFNEIFLLFHFSHFLLDFYESPCEELFSFFYKYVAAKRISKNYAGFITSSARCCSQFLCSFWDFNYCWYTWAYKSLIPQNIYTNYNSISGGKLKMWNAREGIFLKILKIVFENISRSFSVIWKYKTYLTAKFQNFLKFKFEYPTLVTWQ